MQAMSATVLRPPKARMRGESAGPYGIACDAILCFYRVAKEGGPGRACFRGEKKGTQTRQSHQCSVAPCLGTLVRVVTLSQRPYGAGKHMPPGVCHTGARKGRRGHRGHGLEPSDGTDVREVPSAVLSLDGKDLPGRGNAHLLHFLQTLQADPLACIATLVDHPRWASRFAHACRTYIGILVGLCTREGNDAADLLRTVSCGPWTMDK